MTAMTRRTFLATAAAGLAFGGYARAAAPASRPFLFKVRGKAGFLSGGDKLACMNTDGTGFRVLDFGHPTHIGWNPSAFFRDGRRVLLMSIETNDDWKTKPFEEYYHKSMTHLWVYDIVSGSLTEIAQKDRVSPFCSPCALLPGEERLLATYDVDRCGRLYSMNLDGSDPRPVTQPKEFVYGVSVDPEGKRIAFHADYQIGVADMDGKNRIMLTKTPNLLHFGTSWSPDGQWVLYQVCQQSGDPGHNWSDIWIARPDGSENRQLTQGQSAWFASSYGSKENPGNGSIMPRWSPDGSGILYARRAPDSKTPWEYQTGRPDTNHFNRDFKPENARGGTQITLLNPKDGTETPLTHLAPLQWEWRPEWSADSQEILFCRAAPGENPALWVMRRDGGDARILTRGVDNEGAEFPQFLQG